MMHHVLAMGSFVPEADIRKFDHLDIRLTGLLRKLLNGICKHFGLPRLFADRA